MSPSSAIETPAIGTDSDHRFLAMAAQSARFLHARTSKCKRPAGQGVEKGPVARRRPKAAGEAYSCTLSPQRGRQRSKWALIGALAVIESRPMPSLPGFRMPDELRILREQIRRFIQEEIIPLEQRLDPDAPDIPDEDFARLSAKTKAAGLWALGAKEEYGGGGLDTFSMCVALEEMSQHRMGLYNPGCGVFGRMPPPAIWAGSKAQIEKYAIPTVRDGNKTFFAITEPSGGSDPAGAIQTRAEKRGDRWVLNGRKVFISRAHEAPWGIVWARTDKAKGRGGISCFILERGTPGFTAKPIRTIRTSAVPNDVVFEDCEIPAENLIGQEGQGLDLAFDLLVKQRFPYAACNLGVAVAAHKMAVGHAKQRFTFRALLC